MDILGILIVAALVDNLVLDQALGLDPVLALTRKFELALATAISTVAVVTIAIPLSALAMQLIGISQLRLVTMMMVIVLVVALVEVTLRHRPGRFAAILPVMPLVGANSAVLGVILVTGIKPLSLVDSFFYALGLSFGLGLVLITFAGLRQRLAVAQIPESFQGAPIALLTLGLFSLGIMGFQGIFG